MMNIILLFFVLPLATIILSIVLQKILRNAFLTAATFLAIYLILAFTAFDANFLVFAIAYTIISFITATIAEFFFERCIIRHCCNCRNCCCHNNCTGNNVNTANSFTNTPSTTNNRPNTIAVNVRDANNASNNASWCCYRR